MIGSSASMPFLARATNAVHAEPLPTPATPSSDSDAKAVCISAAVARGDEASFRELYDRYHKRVFRLAVVLGRGDESLAHEIVQAVMLTAANKLKPVSGEAHLWNWLARVTRQHLAKAWRAQQREPALVDLAPLVDSVGTRDADLVVEESLDAALSDLEGDERQLVEWFYFDGLSHPEIAEHLSVTPKAVSSRLERIRARLRSLVNRRLSHEA